MKMREALMVLLCIVLVLGQIYFDLTLPDYMSRLTVLIQTPGSDSGEIISVGAKMLGCALSGMLLAVICGYFAAHVAAGFSYSLREDIFDRISSFGKQEMDGFSVPSLIVRTTNDVNQVQMLLAMGIQVMFRAPIMAAWAIIKIIGKSRELSLVTAAFVFAIVLMMVSAMTVLIPRFRKVQKLTDDINRVARENLNGINVVRAFNAEDYQNEKFKNANDALTAMQLFNQRLFAVMMPVMSFAMSGLTLCIYWLGAKLINAIPVTDMMGRVTFFGDVVVFSTYATYVVMSLMMIVMIFMFLASAQVSAGRINEVLEAESHVISGEGAELSKKGSVEFKNVSFHYPDSNIDVLKNITFSAEKGETVAIIGATGCGKTTLVSLAARLYDATAGEVLIDGENIKKLSFEQLYDRVGYITQKPVLFSGSVRDNINFGESAVEDSDGNVMAAIELSEAAEFVNALEEGIDYSITRSGTNLSGGQKQRLSIARAIARKPEILIFDDSFSALDYKTDAKLRAGLREKLADTTILIVAQRIGTIRHADRIIVLDGGAVVGMGKHEELMQNCNVYKEIAMSQLSENELKGE